MAIETFKLDTDKKKLFLRGKEVTRENIARAEIKYPEIRIILDLVKRLRKIEGLELGCLGCQNCKDADK